LPLPRSAALPGQAIVCLVLVSLFYPLASRAISGIGTREEHICAFQVRFVDNEKRPRWSGMSQGCAPIGSLQQWFEECGFEEWARFAKVYGSSIRELRNERGRWVLVVDDAAAQESKPDESTLHRYTPRFLIRLLDEAGQPGKSAATPGP
jgi:hypothetical protein